MYDAAVQVARPPRSWEVGTLVLIVCLAIAGTLGLAFVAFEALFAYYLATAGLRGIPSFVLWTADYLDTANALYIAASIGYFIGFFVWRNRTARMLEDRGHQVPLTHWAITAWLISVGATFVIRFVATSPDIVSDLPTALWIDAALTAARVAGMALLLVGVFALREIVRETVATRRAHSSDERRSALPDRVAGEPTPAQVAADDFWEQARRTASGLRADLALLEVSPSGDRRWLLVSADVSQVRTAVNPSATLVLYPTPPGEGGTRGFKPAPADRYHGFLEDKNTGALAYESVPDRKVGAFLSRARSARRWALYRPEDPAALVVTPS
ncbi:hypothetical protein [Actinoplanes solisilvae]|uniref:hypothetical protein n=1 Tax=Actinoplanes solisilvae TaxID=2486853 RepID=UPI000FDA3504|nr:hypothetical protein [Actinoplanes solisilvae]